MHNKIDWKKLQIEGVRIDELLEFQISYSKEERKITIAYAVDGRERLITCELEAVHFGA